MSRSTEYHNIRTGAQFAEAMSQLMTDIREGTVKPTVANSIRGAGMAMLKVVEMELKWGINGHLDLITPKATDSAQAKKAKREPQSHNPD